jgi:hypothetical protein
MRRIWRRGDRASTVQPYDGGIQTIGNPGLSAATSILLYGPRIGVVYRRDYAPSREYVCDRQDH